MLPMHVGAGAEVIGFVKIFRDETEKLRASEALEKSRAELWQALQETERARAEAEAAGPARRTISWRCSRTSCARRSPRCSWRRTRSRGARICPRPCARRSP